MKRCWMPGGFYYALSEGGLDYLRCKCRNERAVKINTQTPAVMKHHTIVSNRELQLSKANNWFVWTGKSALRLHLLNMILVGNHDDLLKLITELKKRDGNIDELSDRFVSAVEAHIKCGRELDISVFLDNRETMQVADRNGDTFLHVMLRYCEEEVIQRFFHLDSILGTNPKNYVSNITEVHNCINARNSMKAMTPLRLAVRRGFWGTFQSNNPEILHDAAANGNDTKKIEIVRKLIEFGFSVEKENDKGQIPLHIAAKCNNVHIVEELLMKHCRIYDDGRSTSSDLATCSQTGDLAFHLPTISVYFAKMDPVSKAKSITKKDQRGMTPLLYTACSGAWEAAKTLIWCLKEVQASKLYFDENNDGENLIIIAAKNSHSDYLDKLITLMEKEKILDQTFLLKSSSTDHTTALHSVVEHGSLTATKRLIQEKVPIDSLDGKKQTPLHVAAKIGHTHVVEYFMRLPDIVPIINYKDNRLETPLHLAAQFGFDKIVQMLLRSGADPNIDNVDRETPFIVAVTNGHLECVKILLEPSEINKEKEHGTPLHYAAKYGHVYVVQYLLRQGAKADPKTLLLEIRDKQSRTALDIAIDENNE
ncbi:unnamed protein product, partial [Mesorhabditis belari]|uniref:Uncharacterized protein n=1 Tax=Mesorhabditis belari TaxID=2138241 RepID=A0AAF3ER09_9BILA